MSSVKDRSNAVLKPLLEFGVAPYATVATMQDDDVVVEQPPVRCVLSKRSTKRRGGRKDVKYLVAFAGRPDSEAEWFPAKALRKMYVLHTQTEASDWSISTTSAIACGLALRL